MAGLSVVGEKGLGSRVNTALVALFYVVVLYLYEELAFKFPHTVYLMRNVKVTSLVAPAAAASGIASAGMAFVLAYLYVLGALCSSRSVRVLYFVVFVVGALLEYGFQHTLGRYMLPLDLTLIGASSPALWMETTRMYFDPRGLFPVAVFAGLLLYWPRPDVRSKHQAVLTSLFAAGMAVMVLGLKPTKSVDGISVAGLDGGPSYMHPLVTVGVAMTRSARPPRTAVPRPTGVPAPQDNLVVVIDESLRADHLGIYGYARETTPFLGQLVGDPRVLQWQRATSGATCSLSSNLLLITGAVPRPGALEAATVMPTVFAYAKARGYRTWYIDAQTDVLWSGLTTTDLGDVDEWTRASMLGAVEQDRDFVAADRVRAVLDSSVGNFVWINKRGVHYRYDWDYPASAAVWEGNTTASYDNAILYNVDGFFKHLFPPEKPLAAYTTNTQYLYTSDHAESLEVHGVVHCNARSDETAVPMMYIGEPSNVPTRPDLEAPVGHANLTATVFNHLGAPTSAPTLFEARGGVDAPRWFYDGAEQLHELTPAILATGAAH